MRICGWCRTLYIPSGDRSNWNDLLSCTSKLLREALVARGQQAAVVVGESFGGCLGLRVAAAEPDLISHLILVNPATSFSRSFAGLPALIAGTNLLSLFPEPLYQVSPPAHRSLPPGVELPLYGWELSSSPSSL